MLLDMHTVKGLISVAIQFLHLRYAQLVIRIILGNERIPSVVVPLNRLEPVLHGLHVPVVPSPVDGRWIQRAVCQHYQLQVLVVNEIEGLVKKICWLTFRIVFVVTIESPVHDPLCVGIDFNAEYFHMK